MRTGPSSRASSGPILGLALVAVLAGCMKDNVVEPRLRPPPVSPYPKLISPYSVLDALRLAYEARDSTEIKALYDDSYQGTSLDQSVIPLTTLTFTKSDEARHVAALARASVPSVTLLPANTLVRFQDLSDPPGWATVRDPFTSLEISDSVSTYSVDFTGGFQEFKFVPRTPDGTSVTDTTWKIVRWTEVKF